MTLNVYNRSCKDLSQLILDCPLQTSCPHIYYSRHISSEGHRFNWLPTTKLLFFYFFLTDPGSGFNCCAERKCWSRCSLKVWKRPWLGVHVHGPVCQKQELVQLRFSTNHHVKKKKNTITQLHTGRVASWNSDQMVNDIHFNNKENVTIAGHR